MTTRMTAAELHREIEATKADIWLCKRRMNQQKQDYHVVKNLKEINEDVLKWQRCRLQDIN